MIMGALAGLVILFVSGVMKREEADSLITDGMVLMAFIGFVMLVAAGFSNVLTKTGDVESLVKTAAGIMGHSQLVGALLMLIVGLFITMGIGSSLRRFQLSQRSLCLFACSSDSALWQRLRLSERLLRLAMPVHLPATAHLDRLQV